MRLRSVAREIHRMVNAISVEAISPTRWFRRRYELAELEPRRKVLETELSRALGEDITLVSTGAKRGYDEIYFAIQNGRKRAVVRVNRPGVGRAIPIGADDFVVPLSPTERLDREWLAYRSLEPHGIAPVPLWRTTDAVACSWIDWPRAPHVVLQDRDHFWPVMELALPAIHAMHDSGVTHLDLNLGNILVDLGLSKIAFIDFEFGPMPSMSIPQQRAFDYLRLIDECVRPRRGGGQLLRDVDRMIRLLDQVIDLETRQAQMGFARPKLRRLAGCQELIRKLSPLFSGFLNHQ